jgi:hypothetical protein
MRAVDAGAARQVEEACGRVVAASLVAAGGHLVMGEKDAFVAVFDGEDVDERRSAVSCFALLCGVLPCRATRRTTACA